MMIVNLWMLKARNGMYWYARDYVERVTARPTFVVRKGQKQGMADDLRSAGHEVLELGLWGFARLIVVALLDGSFIYTPTPHPIPLLSRQVVVLHDDYPFNGASGTLKTWLFRFGARTSSCTIAYISRSVALPFLNRLRLDGCKTLFAPNIPPSPVPRQPRPSSAVRRCAAVGTDSRKKRYELLLERGMPDDLRLYIHGSANCYTDELQARFGADSFVLVTPDREPFADFIAKADLVVSVAEREGFGRPLALAMSMHLPCHLLESPAFREFFSGSARFYSTVQELLSGITAESPLAAQPDPSGFLGAAYQSSIESAIAVICELSKPRALEL